MKIKRVFSSGGVLFRKRARGIEVALISRAGGKIWCLPKGWVEPGETPEVTALREVQEETGLTGKLLSKIADIHYQYQAPEKKELHLKRVSFYLMKHVGGSTQNHDFEVDEAKWFAWEAALKILSYPNERKILQKAKTLIP